MRKCSRLLRDSRLSSRSPSLSRLRRVWEVASTLCSFLTLGGEQDQDGVKGRACSVLRGSLVRAVAGQGRCLLPCLGSFKAQECLWMHPGFLWADPAGAGQTGGSYWSKTERFWSWTHPSGSSGVWRLWLGVPSHALAGPCLHGTTTITRARGALARTMAAPWPLWRNSGPGPSTSPLASGRAGEGPWPCSLISNRN